MHTKQGGDADQAGTISFIEDVQNVILDFIATGFEKFYSGASSALEEEPTGAAALEQDKARYEEGVRRLHQIVETRARKSVDLFGQVIATNILQPSVRIALPKLDPVQLDEGVSSSLMSGTEDEEELLEKIACMRRDLVKAQRRCNLLAQELRAVDREVARVAGDATEYLAAASIAASNKEAVLMVAERATELQGLLERAESLRQSGVLGEKVKGAFGANSNIPATSTGALAKFARLRIRASAQDA